MTSLTKLTKAQLIARINQCEAETVAAIAFVEAQRTEIAQLKASAAQANAFADAVLASPPTPVAVVPVHRMPVAMHRAYYDYVRSTKAAQRAEGRHTLTYKTMSQWLASQAH